LSWLHTSGAEVTDVVPWVGVVLDEIIVVKEVWYEVLALPLAASLDDVDDVDDETVLIEVKISDETVVVTIN
jgi:hypothetical protein